MAKREEKIPEQPTLIATDEDILNGEKLYSNYCGACHGVGVHGKTIIDLRYITKDKHELFNNIVLNGLLEEKGMSGFSDLLTIRDTENIHAYIIDVATKDRLAQQNK